MSKCGACGQQVTDCIHCGNSGILNIVSSMPLDGTEWDDTPYAAPCHCDAGKLWQEAGLE